MDFEWDKDKASGNLRKHKVSFAEAATVLGDLLSSTFPAPDHSAEEDRFITVGTSERQRVLVVSYTERAGRIRSARRAMRHERKAYEEGER